nr:toxin glutamine deamidase domain-containing protein [Saccharopolyspora sp. ASAGF58]
MNCRLASALPWDPAGETPGWWGRMLAAHFPGAEVVTCATWADAAGTVVDGGVGTRAVVWLRRQVGGRELAGDLLYADYVDDAVVFSTVYAGLSRSRMTPRWLSLWWRVSAVGKVIPSVGCCRRRSRRTNSLGLSRRRRRGWDTAVTARWACRVPCHALWLVSTNTCCSSPFRS